MISQTLSRRAVLGALALPLAGCAGIPRQRVADVPDVPDDLAQMYAAIPEERFPVPAIDVSRLDPAFARQLVDDPTGERPGTLVVDPARRFLYLVFEGRRALRYGVGVGRQGLEWSGRATIERKAEWPRWTPTADMIAREPERNAQWAGGMEGGLQNPLGARALYLYEGNRDTLYRIHGTNEPWSIGRAVSSGCIRMFNQDVIDLHRRVPLGTPVLVRGA